MRSTLLRSGLSLRSSATAVWSYRPRDHTHRFQMVSFGCTTYVKNLDESEPPPPRADPSNWVAVKAAGRCAADSEPSVTVGEEWVTPVAVCAPRYVARLPSRAERTAV